MNFVKPCWFVGASYEKGGEDQTDHFLTEGIWQNGYEDKYLDVVRSMQPGDKIAIKSSYTRKRELPFDSKGQTVSVMGIKAIGVITRNHGDGRFVDVDWEPRQELVKEWYFYTNRSTIWLVSPDEWMTEGLVDFTFNGKPQDIDQFRNAPYWKERFGDNAITYLLENSAMTFKQRYAEYVANTTQTSTPKSMYPKAIQALVGYLNQQGEIIQEEHIYAMGDRDLNALKNRLLVGGDLYSFNTSRNNQAPGAAIGKLIGFKQSIFDHQFKIFKRVFPDFVSFHQPGAQYLNIERDYKMEAIQSAQDLIDGFSLENGHVADVFLQLIKLANFFNWRDQEHIQLMIQSSEFVEGLKCLFQAIKNDRLDAIEFEKIKQHLCSARVDGDTQNNVSKELAANVFLKLIVYSFFLYRPNQYFAMASSYLRRLMHLYGLPSFKKGSYIDYEDFLNIQLLGKQVFEFLKPYEVNGYVDVQSFLWVVENKDKYHKYLEQESEDDEFVAEASMPTDPIEPYTIDDIITDGCFLEREGLIKTMSQLKRKKNIILQGPPGTGKTWLAKKLAYALMGQKDESALRAVQFHPNLSYEDFVRGWRPSGEGKLTLVDGPFLQMVNKAKNAASTKHVIVIEEINRGNPAQIFGEMLTLLEVDKRTPSEALELSYCQYAGEKVHIPENLYVIGTMNIADRSLALVDLALRRRFAFFDLKPTLGEAWRNWVHSKAGIDNDFLQLIEQRIVSLNNEISEDRNLGPQFKIGHSYVTPPLNTKIENAVAWFHGVVETEIGPLLEEYWFDDLERSRKAQEALIESI